MTGPEYTAYVGGEQCTWSANGRETSAHVGARCGATRPVRRQGPGDDAATVAAMNAAGW